MLTVEETLRVSSAVGDPAVFDEQTHRTDTISELETKLIKTPTATGAVRALDEVFVVSEVVPALVSYTIQLDVNDGSAWAKLLVGSEDPPTEIVGEAYLESQVLLGLVQIAAGGRQQLMGYVPAGHYVLLESGGSGTVSLPYALELAF